MKLEEIRCVMATKAPLYKRLLIEILACTTLQLQIIWIRW